MKLINPSVQRIEFSDPYKKIEFIGRTCYKSEDKITDNSAQKFVEGLIKRKHFAMLEHAEVSYKIVGEHTDLELYLTSHIPFVKHSCVVDSAIELDTHLITVSLSHLFNPAWEDNKYMQAFKQLFIQYADSGFDDQGTFGLGVPISADNEDCMNIFLITDLKKELPRIADIFKINPAALWDAHGSYTFKFICDRGVSHELVRHRCSFAQESTRYCNYSQTKFGQEIQFIKPAKFEDWTEIAQDEFIHQLACAESSYMYLTSEQGLSAQEARAILPNALKTEVVMTAPVYQWRHFFDLRSKGTTGAPHPDMKVVADMAYEIFNEAQSYIVNKLDK